MRKKEGGRSRDQKGGGKGAKEKNDKFREKELPVK